MSFKDDVPVNVPNAFRSSFAVIGRPLFFLCVLTVLCFQTAAAQEEEEGQTERSPLVVRSLESDIATSDRDALAAWCLVLGLDDSGSLEDLAARLREHYSLVLESDDSEEPAEPSGGGTRVIIESAHRSEYLNVELGDGGAESVVRLSGEVILTVEESERGRTHRVAADSVVFNQDEGTIAANGNILYVVDTEGREERFTGDSLTFAVSDWTGVIFQGTSERTQDVEGTSINFFFRGESIKRSGRDILVLTNGAVSSGARENPDYSLKAQKIWITGPGEWALFSATLYVGHVPVFYLPFYWKPGSDFFFNPVIGHRTRVGYYLQTTLYLLGRKEQDDGFSIMGFGDSGSGNYDLKRDGLFLVRTPAVVSDETEGLESGDKGQYLKFMLDAYTSLGGMTGFAGKFPNIGEKGQLEFYATLGVSRSINQQGRVYFVKPDSSTTDIWNSGYAGSYKLPFRWGTDFSFKWNRWTLVANWYSDTYYLQDFGNRKENFDWMKFLLGEKGTDSKNPSTITTLKWDFSGSDSWRPQAAIPWLDTISIESLRASLSWKSKKNQDVTKSGNPDAPYDPMRLFFYPDKLLLPEVKFSLQGASPQWTISDEQNNDETPASEGENAELAQAAPEPLQNTPAADGMYIGSFLDTSRNKVLNAQLRYRLKSQFYIDAQTQSSSWSAPSKIDFSFQAARISTFQQGNFSYSADFLNGLTGFSGAMDLSGYYQKHQGLFGAAPATGDRTKLADFKYSKFLWDQNISLYLKPFVAVPSLSTSSLKYEVDTNVFSYAFADRASVASPKFLGEWYSGRDDLKKHRVALALNWKSEIFNLSFSTDNNLPLLDVKYSFKSSAGFSYLGFAGTLSQKTDYASKTWKFKPFLMSTSWSGWNNEASVSQNARFDIENNRFSSAETRLKFWGFETLFKVQRGKTYNWNQATYSWNESREQFAPSNLVFTFKRNWKPLPLWRNRIRFKTGINTSWNINLIQPTSNVLTFSWTQELSIHQFLDLKLSFSATNKSMFLYFPWWQQQLGIAEEHNFFVDLAKSFNFFNVQERMASQFKMNKVSLDLVHKLGSWDLTLGYSGRPYLPTGATAYEWKSEFSIYIKWNPLPMFNQRTKLKDNVWSVDSFL